jgi:hypothetical protein
MPKRCDFFMDSFNLIRSYTGCKLNPKHSKLLSLSLSCVYVYAMGNNLENAHNSLYDTKAQTIILLDNRVKAYWDKSKAIVTVEQIWGKKWKTMRSNSTSQPDMSRIPGMRTKTRKPGIHFLIRSTRVTVAVDK